MIQKIAAKLWKAYYALSTAPTALGTVTELTGLYISLWARTSV